MTTTAPPAATDPDAPQVLLFGHPGAGKSALLGALFQAGEVQREALGGKVIDVTGRLKAIRDAVYNNTPLAAAGAELTRFSVRLDPEAAGAKGVSVALDDCSGAAAESLIHHTAPLADPRTRGPVARAVVEADAIVLLVDAASTDDELQAAFEDFDTFLTVVARSKAGSREVGGFPVLLVLTQCDRLARPGDTFAAWETRVQHREDRAWKKFDAYLKDANPDDGIPSPFMPFGSIDLTVYAVAVRYPTLVGLPAAANAPYGVAEMFRECFIEARIHRARVTSSNRRLKWTVRSSLGLVFGLIFGVLAIAIMPPQHIDTALAERVKGYLLHEHGAAEVRLADANIERNRQALAAFRADSHFGSLPEDLQLFVEGRLKEIADYKAYRTKLAGAMSPTATRSLNELAAVEAALHGDLAPPQGYAWEKTVAGQLREKWEADVTVIRGNEEALLERYRDYVRRGTVLMLTPSFGGNWRADVLALIEEAAHLPYRLSDPIPGSPVLDQPRGEALTYTVPFEYDRVYKARGDWEITDKKLTHLRSLADALGMTSGPGRPEAVLMLPEPGQGIDSATLPANRWTVLLRTFAPQPDGYGYQDWELRYFPDPGRSELARQLERSAAIGVRHVRGLLRASLGAKAEVRDTLSMWRTLADRLGDPASPYPDWGRFLHMLARLKQPEAQNPVGELATFLRQNSFDLSAKSLDLTIPNALSIDRVVPTGPLTITVTPKNGAVARLDFKTSGGGTRSDSNTTYRFTMEGNAKLTYQPGNDLHAELPVRAGVQEFKLVWENGITKTYQFDRLTREPRLVKSTGVSEPAAGVNIAPAPGWTWPTLPALFPESTSR